MRYREGREADVQETLQKAKGPPTDYEAMIARHALRWAELMEARMVEGRNPAEVIAAEAKALSHEADTEGITGAQYGYSILVLIRIWEHGETRRTWHNRYMQFHDEGIRLMLRLTAS